MRTVYSSFDIVLWVLPLERFLDITKPTADMHKFLFSLPFPRPTHLKSYKYLNKVLKSALQSKSSTTIECSIEQLEDAKAISFTPEDIKKEIEEEEATEYYANEFEVLFC